jgi:hypothetical protein
VNRDAGGKLPGEFHARAKYFATQEMEAASGCRLLRVEGLRLETVLLRYGAGDHLG